MAIKHETITANLHRVTLPLGQIVWFSYETAVAVVISDTAHDVIVTDQKHSSTTSKHLGIIRRWADEQGYGVREAEQQHVEDMVG